MELNTFAWITSHVSHPLLYMRSNEITKMGLKNTNWSFSFWELEWPIKMGISTLTVNLLFYIHTDYALCLLIQLLHSQFRLAISTWTFKWNLVFVKFIPTLAYSVSWTTASKSAMSIVLCMGAAGVQRTSIELRDRLLDRICALDWTVHPRWPNI